MNAYNVYKVDIDSDPVGVLVVRGHTIFAKDEEDARAKALNGFLCSNATLKVVNIRRIGGDDGVGQ